jgi:hypothetical protein
LRFLCDSASLRENYSAEKVISRKDANPHRHAKPN